jgi:hypothetical protein
VNRTTVVHELTTTTDVAVLLVIEMKLGFFLDGTSNHQMRADAVAQAIGQMHGQSKCGLRTV